MDSQPYLPESAATLLQYADAHPGTDETLVLLEIITAGTHPDFVMSLASARLLPLELRATVAEFVRYALIDGLAQEQQHFLFSWAQRKMMDGPGQAHRVG